jgi:hypothetical protein
MLINGDKIGQLIPREFGAGNETLDVSLRYVSENVEPGLRNERDGI